MVDIPMKTGKPVDSRTVLSINQRYIQKPKSTRDILDINRVKADNMQSAGNINPENVIQSVNTGKISDINIPKLINTVRKGQKVLLETNKKLTSVKACIGWNVKNQQCDVDVSAFMLGNNGKVLGDNWFVFYGQEKSPDNSTVFSISTSGDREDISIDLTKINSAVAKIVFVLTINEALEKNLNFGMIKDAYIRIMDCSANTETVSFMMDEYYSNVTSMMIGELYLHNGVWKFNAIGNGVARDLAGLCELYGVQIE